MAGRERAGRAAAVDGHRGGLGAPPGVGGQARRGALVGGLVAAGLPRPRGLAGRVGDLRGGVLPRRRARPGLPERHLPAGADHLRPRHQGAAGPVPAVDGDRRADLGAVLVRARGRLRPGLARLDRAPRRRARRLGAQRPEDLVVAGDVRALGLRAVPLRPGGGAAPRADLLPLPAGRRRRHGAADRPARRRGRLRGGVLRGRLRARLRRARRGRRRLVGRDEHGGQRARAVAALPRPVLRRRRPAGRALPRRGPDPRAADGVVDAWIKAQAYRFYTWGTVTRLANGGDMGAAGSVNKVFWSELDIALHETALDLLGPEAELESPWLDGYTFSLSGPIYAGTNEVQRNIVAERILGLPREPKGSARSEVRARPTTSATSPPRSTGCWPAPTPPKVARAWADGDHEPGLKLWSRLAEQGVTMLATEATPVEVCVAFEALGRHAVPGPVGRVRGLPPGRAGPRGRGHRDGRGAAARAARAGRRRRRRGVRRRRPLATEVGSDARLGRPHPAALRGRRGDGAAGTRAFDLAVLADVGPAARARASGCWPTRSPT